MKQPLLIALTVIILTLFVFSGDILLKINESVLGKLFFVILIILYAHENTLYGLFIAILFFIVNEKFTYTYYENMVGSRYEPTTLNEPVTKLGKDAMLRKNVDSIKPTSSGVIELSEQLRPSNPRSVPHTKTNNSVADTDLINMVANRSLIQTSSFQTIPSSPDIDTSNLYPVE